MCFILTKNINMCICIEKKKKESVTSERPDRKVGDRKSVPRNFQQLLRASAAGIVGAGTGGTSGAGAGRVVGPLGGPTAGMVCGLATGGGHRKASRSAWPFPRHALAKVYQSFAEASCQTGSPSHGLESLGHRLHVGSIERKSLGGRAPPSPAAAVVAAPEALSVTSSQPATCAGKHLQKKSEGASACGGCFLLWNGLKENSKGSTWNVPSVTHGDPCLVHF